MSRGQNYEFQEWWNKQRQKNYDDLFPGDGASVSSFITLEIRNPSGDRTADKDRSWSARQLSWVCLLRFQQLANFLSWIASAFLVLLQTVSRRISSADTPADSSASRLYRITRFFLVVVILLLCVEMVAYFKDWHLSRPSAAEAEAAVEFAYAKWLEADYLAPPLQSLANLCIILFLILSVGSVVLMLGCFWIKIRRLKPTAVMEYPSGRLEGENIKDYPMVLVQIPMCNVREVYQQSIGAVCIMDWPKERMLVQVLDESDDLDVQVLIKSEVQKWQQRGVHIIYRHRLVRTGYKAGNLKSAVSCDYIKDYEFLAIFDADFQPAPDFLKKTIPYFKGQAFSSMVSSPAESNSNVSGDGSVIRKLIGKVGNIRSSVEILPQSQPLLAVASYINDSGNNSANASCYSTPLSSPPKLNLPEELPKAAPPVSSNVAEFSADPGFAERAARFSCFGSRSFNGRASHFGLSNKVTSEIPYGSHTNPLIGNVKLPHVSSSPSLKALGFVGNPSFKHQPEMPNSHDQSTVSEPNPNGNSSLKTTDDSNSRKRQATPKGKSKEAATSTSANATKSSEANEDSNSKRCKQNEGNGSESMKTEEEAKDEAKQSKTNSDNTKPPEPPKDYIHVRARRGQATDSHSLAERVRREKISERMKVLQDLVPGCNRVTGKAHMLDEIINYVQLLQRQVEMKLASLNTGLDIDMDTLMSKDVRKLSSRANNFQAIDSHSLAERVRREKISERMKFLQDLVPGCNKVTGKALMLDEIINYVQSLQRQVEFLSMKLASRNTRLDINIGTLMSKDIFQPNSSLAQPIFPLASTFFDHQVQDTHQNPALYNRTITQCGYVVEPIVHLTSLDQFTATIPPVNCSTYCEGDLQTIVQMGFGQNPDPEQDFHGSNQVSHMNV